jgi:SAM-dependent methyltransferase
VPGGEPGTADSFLPRYDTEFAPRLRHRAATFRRFFELLEARQLPFYRILETGCARQPDNWDGDGQSTLLFDAFVNHHDGQVVSVDLDRNAVELARRASSPKTEVMCGHSVPLLFGMSRRNGGICAFDAVYLDSLDFDVHNPFPSAFHCIKELLALGRLPSGLLLMIDDNPAVRDGRIGKGMLVAQYLRDIGVLPLLSAYQMIWQMP